MPTDPPGGSGGPDPSTFAQRTIDAVETLLSRAAQEFVRGLAAARKIQPLHLALAVPGLCHTHNPCKFLADDCAYCARAGNVFVAGPAPWRPGVRTDRQGATDRIPQTS